MGLFATLAASAGADGAGENDHSISSTISLPTAVQMHTSHRIDFVSGLIDGRNLRGPTSAAVNNTGGTTATAKRRFETLSYQAVEVTAQQDGEGRSGSILQQQQQPSTSKANKKHQRPNLGIWDVRLPDTSTSEGSGGTEGDSDKSTDLVNRLLQKVISSPSQETVPPTVIFALDLADPAAVYPAMEAMVGALLRRYDTMSADGGSSKMTASASASAIMKLSKLRATKFGAAPEQSEEAPSKASGGGSADTRIALIICCAVPPTPAEVGPEGSSGAISAPQSFQEKQAVSLVHYHLHRFAAEVDCTLAFVRPDDDGMNPAATASSGDEGGEGDNASATAKSKGAIPSLTVSELAAVVSRVAQGMPPLEEEEKRNDDDDEAGEGDETEEGQDGTAAPGLEQPPIFAPGTHDDDLIGSVLLRNASCPGVWDAAKDDLWKALPSLKAGGVAAQKASDKKKDVKVGGAAADEAWLSKLAASLPAQGATGGGDDVSVKTSKSSKSSATATGSSVAKASTKKKRITRSTAAKADTKNDDPTSFFENLMKK